MIPKIAIPSYDRPELLIKVLKKIKNYNFKQKPYIFLANKEQLKKYKHIKNCEFIITNTKGIQKTRNFIYSFFNINDFVVCFDDSFTGLVKKKQNKLVEFIDIKKLCDIGYNEMKKKDTCMFGINIVENPFFMKNIIQYGNYLLSAKFFGFIKQRTSIMNSINLSGLCEDQETCLRVVSFYGGVIRFSGISFDKPQYRGFKGGIQSQFTKEQRVKAHKKGCKILSKMFPNYCKLKEGGNGLRLLTKYEL
jgi:hypothetical protein